MTPPEATTISRLFATAVAELEHAPALRTPEGSLAWTWGEYGRAAAAAAAGLANLGVGRGSVIACWLTNRPEFHAADIGAALLGAASFSIYPTDTVEQAAHVVGDAGSTVLITEPAFLERALAVRASGDTALETMVCLDEKHAGTVGWDELLSQTGEAPALEELAAAAAADDVLTIIYTSGTTGPPKGVELTHANVLAQVRATSAGLRLSEWLSAISYLPMAHIAERLVTHYLPIAHGWRVTTCDDARAIGTLLAEVRPEVFFSPPRLWEKLRAAALAKFDGDQSLAVAARDAVLARFGLDAVRVAIVGAAPCPPEVVRFWHELGIPLCEVYGLSETAGVAAVNPPDAIRAGAVGMALPGVEVRLSDAGEVLGTGCGRDGGPATNRTRQPGRSIQTDGCTRAISACSTRTGTCGSSTASRRSSSTRRARTCHRSTSRPR